MFIGSRKAGQPVPAQPCENGSLSRTYAGFHRDALAPRLASEVQNIALPLIRLSMKDFAHESDRIMAPLADLFRCLTMGFSHEDRR